MKWLDENLARHVRVMPRTIEVECWPEDMNDDIGIMYINDEGFRPEQFGYYSDAEMLRALADALARRGAARIRIVRLTQTRDPMSGFRASWRARMPERVAMFRRELARVRVRRIQIRVRTWGD